MNQKSTSSDVRKTRISLPELNMELTDLTIDDQGKIKGGAVAPGLTPVKGR